MVAKAPRPHTAAPCTAQQWFTSRTAGGAHKERDQRRRPRRSSEAAHSSASHCTAVRIPQQDSWRRSQRARSAAARTAKLRGRTQQRLALHSSGSPARQPAALSQGARSATARTPKLRGSTKQRPAARLRRWPGGLARLAHGQGRQGQRPKGRHVASGKGKNEDAASSTNHKKGRVRVDGVGYKNFNPKEGGNDDCPTSCEDSWCKKGDKCWKSHANKP